MQREKHIIDATNKPLGRLSTQIVALLRGKHKPDFAPHKDEGDIVIIQNIAQIKITGKKFKNKTYYHHTGWPGGFRKQTMEEIVAKKGFGEILRKAVYGMLPKNKLRAKQIKRLKVE